MTLYPPVSVQSAFSNYVASHGGKLSAIDSGYLTRGSRFYSLNWNHTCQRWSVLECAWPNVPLHTVFLFTLPEATRRDG